MEDFITVTIKEAQERFGELFEIAVNGTPVIITRAGKPSVVMVRYLDYLDLKADLEHLQNELFLERVSE